MVDIFEFETTAITNLLNFGHLHKNMLTIKKMFSVLDQPRTKLRWEAQGHQTLYKKPKYLFVLIFNQQRLPSQHTCLRSTKETLEKGKKHMFKVKSKSCSVIPITNWSFSLTRKTSIKKCSARPYLFDWLLPEAVV